MIWLLVCICAERIRKKRNSRWCEGAEGGAGVDANASPRVRPWPDAYKYEATSLACLSLQNPLRQLCIWGIEQSWWDNGVLILILLNTLQLAMYDPLDTPANLAGKCMGVCREGGWVRWEGVRDWRGEVQGAG